MKPLLNKARSIIDTKYIYILYELDLHNKNNSIICNILSIISNVLYAIENL